MIWRVLLVPEDFRNDQHILKPIIEKMFATIAEKAVVRVCRDPLIGTVNQAMRWEVNRDILARYRYETDIFILCVDRDAEETRRVALDNLEKSARDFLDTSTTYFAIEAHQEIETWVLAGHDYARTASEWARVRATRDVKEIDFWPFATTKGFPLPLPSGTLHVLTEQAVSRYERMVRRSPELKELQERIRAWIETQS